MTTKQERTLENPRDYLRLMPDSTAREVLETVEEAITYEKSPGALTHPGGDRPTEKTLIIATNKSSASSTPCSSTVTADRNFEETSNAPKKPPEQDAVRDGEEVLNSEIEVLGNSAHGTVIKRWSGADVKLVRTSKPIQRGKE